MHAFVRPEKLASPSASRSRCGSSGRGVIRAGSGALAAGTWPEKTGRAPPRSGRENGGGVVVVVIGDLCSRRGEKSTGLCVLDGAFSAVSGEYSSPLNTVKSAPFLEG